MSIPGRHNNFIAKAVETTGSFMPNVLGDINKTMSRSDLLTDEAKPLIRDLNSLISQLYSNGLHMSSWTGSLPPGRRARLKGLIYGLMGKPAGIETRAGCGLDQRLDYEPLPHVVDDGRIPWFLYWETFWVMKVTKPLLHGNARLLDCGGASSLFACYLASLGLRIHAVDLNKKLVANGEIIAREMGWRMRSYAMNMGNLAFPDECFDHAYSICVFEHLDYEIKQSALAEIARCLKPGGILSITFDYRNPAPGIAGYGKDTRPKNQLKDENDIARSFFSNGLFELAGNQRFLDNGESYLVHRRFDNTPYTFGAIFLRKLG